VGAFDGLIPCVVAKPFGTASASFTITKGENLNQEGSGVGCGVAFDRKAVHWQFHCGQPFLTRFSAGAINAIERYGHSRTRQKFTKIAVAPEVVAGTW
jgi:hypothetical protein